MVEFWARSGKLGAFIGTPPLNLTFISLVMEKNHEILSNICSICIKFGRNATITHCNVQKALGNKVVVPTRSFVEIELNLKNPKS